MDTFADFAKDIGIGILPYEDDPDLLELVAILFSSLGGPIDQGVRHGEPMKLDFHVADVDGLNAFAATFIDGDVIVFNRDVMAILRAVFRAVLRQGLMFTNRSGEKASEPSSTGITLGEFLRQDDVWRSVQALNPEQEEIAATLTQFTAVYILVHEFAHIYNGHTDYLGSRYGLALVAELEGDGLPSIKGLERETLEWDADAAGIQHLLGYALCPRVTLVNGVPVWEIPDIGPWGAKEDVIQMILVALETCFAIFSSGDPSDPFDTAPCSHPHPLLRAINAVQTVGQVIAFRTGMSREDVSKLMKMPEGLRESFLSTFKGRDPTTVPDNEKVSEAYLARLREWEKTWELMYPELDVLKRGGRLAPAVQQPHPAFPTSEVFG